MSLPRKACWGDVLGLERWYRILLHWHQLDFHWGSGICSCAEVCNQASTAHQDTYYLLNAWMVDTWKPKCRPFHYQTLVSAHTRYYTFAGHYVQLIQSESNTIATHETMSTWSLSHLGKVWNKRIPTTDSPFLPLLVKFIRDSLIDADSDVRFVRSEA